MTDEPPVRQLKEDRGLRGRNLPSASWLAQASPKSTRVRMPSAKGLSQRRSSSRAMASSACIVGISRRSKSMRGGNS